MLEHVGDIDGEKGSARGEWRPWRADEAVWVAGMDMVIAGVSYLL